MSTLITILHIIVCVFLMLTVLLQSGQGGGMGGAFGGGNASTVFGGGGASTFLRKLTASAGVAFMLTSMVLAYIASRNGASSLEKYGNEEDEKAAVLEKQRVDAVNGSGAGSAVGSAGSAQGIVTPLLPNAPKDLPGSAAVVPDGSASMVAAPGGSAAGSATVVPAPTGSAAGSATLAPPPSIHGSAAVAPAAAGSAHVAAPAAAGSAHVAAPAAAGSAHAAAGSAAAPATVPAPSPVIHQNRADAPAAGSAAAAVPPGTP